MQDTIAIRVARSTPVHRLRAIPHTACATTATAAIFKPCSIPLGTASPQAEIPSAKRMSTIAEGSVKPNQAASAPAYRSEEHTSELQSLMRISYAVFCLKKKKHNKLHIVDVLT